MVWWKRAGVQTNRNLPYNPAMTNASVNSNANATANTAATAAATSANDSVVKTATTPAAAILQARAAQLAWAERLVRERMRIIGHIAAQIAEHHTELVALNPRANASRAELVASELLPLADACRYAARVTRRALAPTTHSARRGAWWMGRIGVQVVRQPWGVVLVVAPSNYPLFLPGVQIIQALAAGNAVIVKPAIGCEPLLRRFAQCVSDAGVPPELLQILDSSIVAGQQAMDAGVDKVFVTGSAETGRAILSQLSQTLTPATLELSGCDAAFVTDRADLKRVARCLAYALRLNGGATCIAPRRVFVSPAHEEQLCQLLLEELRRPPDSRNEATTNQVAVSQITAAGYQVPIAAAEKLVAAVQQALAGGAQLFLGSLPDCAHRPTHVHVPPLVLRGVTPSMDVAQQDLFGPIVSMLTVPSMSAAIEADRVCPFGLGASIFGPSNHAHYWSKQIDAGCVVINDIVVPTADPRVGFGGRDHSGWGSTRGWEGLVEMTRPQTICTRAGRWLPHLDPTLAQDPRAVEALLTLFHAPKWSSRLAALGTLITHRS